MRTRFQIARLSIRQELNAVLVILVLLCISSSLYAPKRFAKALVHLEDPAYQIVSVIG